MPFELRGWKLYQREVKLTRGPRVTLYFFSRRVPKSGTPANLPPGRTFAVSAMTGIPFLVKRGEAREELGFEFQGWRLYQIPLEWEAGDTRPTSVFAFSQEPPDLGVPQRAPPEGFEPALSSDGMPILRRRT